MRRGTEDGACEEPSRGEKSHPLCCATSSIQEEKEIQYFDYRVSTNGDKFLSLSFLFPLSSSIFKIDGVVFKSSREHASFKRLFTQLFDSAGTSLCGRSHARIRTCCHKFFCKFFSQYLRLDSNSCSRSNLRSILFLIPRGTLTKLKKLFLNFTSDTLFEIYHSFP